MSRLPSITPKTILKFLKTRGFLQDHISGSHIILYHPTTKHRAVVPHHLKDLPQGTMHSIIREAGFSRQELLDFLQE